MDTLKTSDKTTLFTKILGDLHTVAEIWWVLRIILGRILLSQAVVKLVIGFKTSEMISHVQNDKPWVEIVV